MNRRPRYDSIALLFRDSRGDIFLHIIPVSLLQLRIRETKRNFQCKGPSAAIIEGNGTIKRSLLYFCRLRANLDIRDDDRRYLILLYR